MMRLKEIDFRFKVLAFRRRALSLLVARSCGVSTVPLFLLESRTLHFNQLFKEDF
ncbi:hypothetical protein QUF84_27385 [Fictibacillus enclensis]|uniref:hypothetical protein n=1 Tax=Fictibacillus enclensis TaxID=1017270 RepID=UPI00259FF93C|nr:hypothetical protein [Fictibacillus enclensis]MDM5340920.1 hypothetical protein [Fictibacillus enclensis]